MVICKSYAKQLSCRKLTLCPDEHINVKDILKVELEAAINGNQWPLSCFGPFWDKPCVPNYIEDQSFEEIRFMYYSTDRYSFFESCQKFTKAIDDAKEKMRMLFTMNRDVVDVLITVYDYVDQPLKLMPPFETNFGSNEVKWFVSNSSSSTRNMFKGPFPPPPPNPVFTALPKDCELKKYDFIKAVDKAGDTKSGFFSPEPLPNVLEKQGKSPLSATSTQLLKLLQKQEKVPGFFSSEKLQKLQANALGSKVAQDQKSTQTDLEKPECHDCKEHLKDLMTKMDVVLEAINQNNEKSKEQEKNLNSLMESFKKINLDKEPKHNAVTGHEPALRIRPKFKQSSEKTKEEVKNILSPFGYFNLGLQISIMMKSTHGSIIIRCKNEESLKKIEEEVAKSSAEHYSTEPVKLAMPKILVNGIDFQIDEDNLVGAIKKQNQIDGHVNLVRTFERENVHKYNAILEVDKNVYWSIMRARSPHLYVGWNKCVVYENIDIKRCYKCWGYNHHSQRCRNEKRCPKCAGQHSADVCTSPKLRCANCSMANIRLNLKLDQEHDVRNYHCYVYLSKVKQERRMIDY